MTLRSTFVALLAVLLLGVAAVPAGAGVGNYASPLYLAGPASTIPTMGSSYTLLANTYPAPVAAGTGSGTAPPAGTYRYLYIVEGTTESVSVMSEAEETTSPQNIELSGLPTGVTVRIYRHNTAAATNLFHVATLPANSSSTYVDDHDPTAPTDTLATKKAENRVQSGIVPAACLATQPCTGYFDLQPAVALGGANNDDVLPFPPAAPNKRGWVVNGAGSVHIPAGNWTFTARVKAPNTNAPTGDARMVVAMWKLDDSGNVVGDPLLAPTQGTANLVRPSPPTTIEEITITANPGAISLAEDEHLYVQFWRRQQVQYTTGGAGQRVVTMYLFDGVARIEHPGAVADPTLPTQSAPAAAATTYTWPQLSARFDDPIAGDTGTLEFQLCSDVSCGTVLATVSAAGIANGATGTVTVPTQSLGTYHWRVRSTDSGGGISSWSATRSFTYSTAPPPPPPPPDTTAPRTPTLGSPAAGAATAVAPMLAASLNDASEGPATIEFRVCTQAAPAGFACAPVAASSTTSLSPGGGGGSFAPPLAKGEYHWQARAIDAAGNASSWTETSSFTYDADAPATPAPAGAGNGALGARFESGDGKGGTVEFRVCSSPAAAGTECAPLVAAGSAAVTASGGNAEFAPELPHGVHHWQTRAVDAAGNASPWTATRTLTVDREPPAAPVLDGPRDGFVSRDAPEFTARGDGALEIRVCADAACKDVVERRTLSAGEVVTLAPVLGYGEYFWQARSRDEAGNTSRWTPVRSVTFAADEVGRGTDLPLEGGPAVEPEVGIALESVTCQTNGRLQVHIVLSDPAEVSLVLVQRSKARGARWRQVAAKRVTVGAGSRTIKLETARPLRRDLSYRLRVEVDGGDVKEARSFVVRLNGGAPRSTVCEVTP